MGAVHILLYLRWYNEKLGSLFDKINNDFKYQSETLIQEVNMEDAIRKCTIITYGWMLLGILSSQAIALFIIFSSHER